MNINTATILNLLSPKINPAVKEKIENLSVNGKIDLDTISKDKGIQTLLTGLMKDVATGLQTKENITTLLENNKQTFSFKNLTEDIKTLIKSIQSEPLTNSKLETQLASLKGSLIDINNIDEKIIKTNVSNSGVFLESKLAQQVIPASKNIEQMVQLIKGQLEVVSTSTVKSDIPTDVKQELKNTIENILKDIKSVKAETNPQNQSLQLSKIDSQIKTIQERFGQIGLIAPKYDFPKIDNVDTIKTQLKEQLSILTGGVNTNIVQQKVFQIESNTNISQDLKLEIKNAIESLLRDIKNIKAEQSPQKQLQNLSSLETKILTTQHNLNTSIVKNDIIPTIKDLFLNLKEQVLNKNFAEIQTGFTLLDEKIGSLNEQVVGAKNIKMDIANILDQLKNFNSVKMPQQQQVVLQNIFNNTQLVQTKIDTLPQVLFENNLSKTTNFIHDLKITASIIEEYANKSNEPITKELKMVIDKINTQIDYYQLLSYATNSTHTYLSFLQDEIEDSDIKFHKNINDDSFSCQINLTLKQYGDLKILMILDNKNHININIGLEREDFKSMVQENLQKLRIGINSINLLIQSLNVFSLNSTEQKSIKNSYGSTHSDLSFGLDIKA